MNGNGRVMDIERRSGDEEAGHRDVDVLRKCGRWTRKLRRGISSIFHLRKKLIIDFVRSYHSSESHIVESGTRRMPTLVSGQETSRSVIVHRIGLSLASFLLFGCASQQGPESNMANNIDKVHAVVTQVRLVQAAELVEDEIIDGDANAYDAQFRSMISDVNLVVNGVDDGRSAYLRILYRALSRARRDQASVDEEKEKNLSSLIRKRLIDRERTILYRIRAEESNHAK